MTANTTGRVDALAVARPEWERLNADMTDGAPLPEPWRVGHE